MTPGQGEAPAVVHGNDFAGLVAVVTGGASGIGAATAKELTARGARVVSLDLSVDAEADLALHCDVSDDQSVRHAIVRTIAECGRLDIVVNNAGVGSQGSVEASSDESWRLTYEVNVLGTVHVSRASLPHLSASPSAAIVNTGSIAAWTGLQQRAAYSASKGAVHALTLAMAADYVAEGIRVNAVAPGTANTPWVQRLLDSAPDPDKERAALDRRQPLGRLVEPDEIAAAICYLASPSSGSTTGTIVAVDGGSHGLLITR